jgi:hypothetical protein
MDGIFVLGPHLKALRVLHHLWQAAGVRSVGPEVRQQIIIGAAVTVPPVVYRPGEVGFFATSIESNQARMICPAMVGIFSS